MKPKIAILSNASTAWSLPTWQKTLPLLKEHYDVCGLAVFPERLSTMSGIHIPLWYAKTFGLKDTLICSLFTCKKICENFLTGCSSWHSLAASHTIPFFVGNNPNDEATLDWLTRKEPDVAIIMLDSIIKKRLLGVPKIGMINKHAALLPSCKGLFPYFWAICHELPLGISFHEVLPQVDAGRILLQETVDKSSVRSMLQFYQYVFLRYPEMLVQAIENLLANKFQAPQEDLQASYYGIPCRNDVKTFRQNNGRIACFKDLFT